MNGRNKTKKYLHRGATTYLLLLLLLPSASKSEVVSCIDKQGKTLFTDNKTLCANKNIAAVKITPKCGKKVAYKHQVNYCKPRRAYQRAGRNWAIYLEKSLVESDKILADKALLKLEKNLNEIIGILPANPARKLKELDIYLMWGKKSPNGGRAGGMSYIRPGETNNYFYLDPRWQHAIIIYSAKTLMYLDDVWTKKALMHELAHAWHISNWPQRHPPIYEAYLSAKEAGLYQNIKDYKGKDIDTAYALKNQMEYFADLSSVYFVGGNYFPFNKKGLSTYDPNAIKMLRELWGGE